MNAKNDPYLNFKSAILQLDQFIAESTGSPRDRAAVIQAFEFTFEAVWRAFKKDVEKQEQNAPFPRLAIAGAFQLGLIRDEKGWLAMIKDRNLTSHTYDEALSEKVYKNIVDRYVGLFHALRDEQGQPK